MKVFEIMSLNTTKVIKIWSKKLKLPLKYSVVIYKVPTYLKYSSSTTKFKLVCCVSKRAQ